ELDEVHDSRRVDDAGSDQSQVIGQAIGAPVAERIGDERADCGEDLRAGLGHRGRRIVAETPSQLQPGARGRHGRDGGSAWESNPPGPPPGQPPLVLKTRPDTSPDPLPWIGTRGRLYACTGPPQEWPHAVLQIVLHALPERGDGAEASASLRPAAGGGRGPTGGPGSALAVWSDGCAKPRPRRMATRAS